MSQGRGLGEGGRVSAHPSRPGRRPLLSLHREYLPEVRNPAPPPPGGTHPSLAGRWRKEGIMSSSGGPGGWGRVTSGFYHGGGVGGGPGPGVCGSPPSSRARRFHFPGCPGVNIRVSAPLPQRRAAATFLPRPGQPGPAPHAAGSPPMSAQGRGDRQVWSAAPGGGARIREVRGGSCGRDRARRLTGWAGWGSGPLRLHFPHRG